MAYSTNPHLPRLRMDAVKLVRTGWSIRRVARHFGFHHTAVMRWVRRAAQNSRVRILPTHSSRPHHHPHELSNTLVQMILCYREHYQRDAFFIHHLLTRDGVTVSLSSVKRTLRRYHLTYPSKWKKWHYSVPRPLPAKPGFLVEIDTIHDGGHEDRLYIYTLLDVCSRWAYATPVARINTHGSLRFVETARHHSPFLFATLQSDHGSEFSKWFTTQIEARGLRHRHSRVRQPNDNAHLERWNRTLQQECLSRVSRSLSSWQRAIPEYLRYYNEERPHMGLLMKTPIEVVRSY